MTLNEIEEALRLQRGTYMYLDEPVDQDGTSGIGKMPRNVGVEKRVSCLSPLQGGKTGKQEAREK